MLLRLLEWPETYDKVRVNISLLIAITHTPFCSMPPRLCSRCCFCLKCSAPFLYQSKPFHSPRFNSKKCFTEKVSLRERAFQSLLLNTVMWFNDSLLYSAPTRDVSTNNREVISALIYHIVQEVDLKSY